LAAAIAVGLASFAVFHWLTSFDHRWIAPTLLSSADPRVVQVAAALQAERARRDELVLRKGELETRLRRVERWTELEQSVQASFQGALRSGRAGGYDVLALRRAYDDSVAASEEARESAGLLRTAISDLSDALARQDALLASIEASPYALAISGDAALGFVPYENLAQVRPGDALVACAIGASLCHPVGTVGELVPGEVHGTSPFGGGDELRGRLVRMALSDPLAARMRVLYAPSHRK
jgi:hypothetical protein